MKAPMLGLIVAAAACAASSLYLWHELDEQRAQAAQVEEANRKLQARLAELERPRALFAQRHMASASGFAGGQPGHGVPPPPIAPDTAITADTERGPPAEVWNTAPPERSAAFKKVMRAQLKVANKRLYADLGAELGLDKNTTDKLIDLLAAQQLEMFDQTTPADQVLSEQKFAELQRQNQAAIEALIGSEKAQAFEDYQQSTPARNEFDMLSRQLEANEVPLTAEQAKKLRTAYIEERARVPQPAYAEADGGSDKYFKSLNDWQEDYERRVSDTASSILSNDQLAAFNEIQQWNKEMRNGIALSPGGGPRTFFRPGGAVPMGAVAGAVTFALPAPPPAPPGAAEAGKP